MKKKKNFEKEKKLLKKIFFDKTKTIKNIIKNKKWGFNKDWESFAYGLALTNPQTYGLRIQNRIIKELKAKTVDPKEDRGDYLGKNGRYVEMKTSILTDKNSLMNVVQIRPWQETDYHCAVLDMRNGEVIPYSFMLTKEQMQEEVKIMSSNSHGTQNSNKDNLNVEKRFSINVNVNDKNFKRWLDNYQVNFDMKKKSSLTKKSSLSKKYKKIKEKINEIKKDKKWGFNNDWETFIFGMSIMNPQTYGVRIQNRLIYELEMLSVTPKEEKGDFEDILGNKFECKASLIVNDSGKFNVVQIRPWQNTNYKCLLFDLRDGAFTPYLFELTHEEMLEELKLLKSKAAHGTLQSNINNKNIEYRFSIDVNENNPDFLRWIDKYQVEYNFNRALTQEEILIVENINIMKKDLQKNIIKKVSL